MTDKMDDAGAMDGMSFEELLESHGENLGRELKQGDMVEGKIISIGKTNVYIDTDTKSDGVVDRNELLDDDGNFSHEVGDTVKLYVVSLSESEVILSKAISGAGKAAMLEEAAHNKTPVEGKVKEVIKGGYHVDMLGKRAFCPVSQMDVRYVETPEDFVGQTFNFIISRFEENGRNIVVSRRTLLEAEIRESRDAFLKDVSEGDTLQGSVTKLMKFGAFIELAPGVEGMAHISELSWSRVEKPEEVVRTGDKVFVKLLKIEKKEGQEVPKISLSIKQTAENPWDSMDSAFKVGDQVTGKVVRLTSFGAFVEIAPGVDGLVHISEMSHVKRVIRPEDMVEVGQEVLVSIKAIDLDAKRVSLSMKDAQGDPWTGASVKYPAGEVMEGVFERREKFGLFIRLEPGVTGLMPASAVREAENQSLYDGLKPGDTVKFLVTQVDEEARRMTLVPPDQKDPGNWKQFAAKEKSAKPMGTMEAMLREALAKQKK